MTENTPTMKVLVKNQFLFDGDKSQSGFTEGVLVSVRAVKGKALTFSVLLENGVLFTGLPIHALGGGRVRALHELEMWDCLSYSIDVFELGLLRGMRVSVKLTTEEILQGEYVFTVDFNCKSELSGLAETPDEWKMLHFVRLDEGNFCLYPQNRIIFMDQSLASKAGVIPGYKVNTSDWKAETWAKGIRDGYRY